MNTSQENIIEKFKKTPTPFYFYDINLFKKTLDLVVEESARYNYHVHYALKANSNPQILKVIQEYGLGADCVSGNEITRALDNGFRSEQIVFAGVGKSDAEINTGLDQDIFCFNCESIPELQVIDELAAKKNKVAKIALRINPNVKASTHHYITTGLAENKFGINLWELEEVIALLKQLKNLNLIGLHFHIGSQITELNNFKSLCLRVNEIQKWFYERQTIVAHINVGGGFGINYENPELEPIPDFKAFFQLFKENIDLRPEQSLHFELGRSLVGQCGSLISQVLYVKKGVNTKFAIIDAGMTELLRPALYQALHKIENLSALPKAKEELYDVVGPICESSDYFGKAIKLPEIKRGHLIQIKSCGAYGEVMASQYNLRQLPKAIYSTSL